MDNARSVEATWPAIRPLDPKVPAAEMSDLRPWSMFRSHAGSIGVRLATCLIVLLAIELAIFRSGFFATHLAVSNPQIPAAKLALAVRHPDARVVYVGDSTIMTSVLPAVVSATCDCGAGFNGGFSAATPWLTNAMTWQLLGMTHPKLVVIDVTPWTFDSNARFVNGELARQLMSPGDLAALGAPLDFVERVDDALGRVWSAYGQRLLLKEWLSSLAPGQRYDEALLGYYVAPGSANSSTRLAAELGRLFGGLGQPTPSAPGALVIGSLINELRARDIAVAIFEPPLHPAAYGQVGGYLEGADAAVREFANQHRVPLIDCRAAVSSADFRDAVHLVESGARKHSLCVGNQIQALVHG